MLLLPTHRLQGELAQSFAARVPATWSSSAQLPYLPLQLIPGTYVDPGYGEIDICHLHGPMIDVPLDGLNNVNPACYDLLDFNPFVVSEDSTSRPTYVARFAKDRTAYLLFEHAYGSVFTVTVNTIFPTHDVSSRSVIPSFKAIFTEEGMVWLGNVWGSWPPLRNSNQKKDSPGEVAEVLFERVQYTSHRFGGRL
jgi:hypothetical protein